MQLPQAINVEILNGQLTEFEKPKIDATPINNRQFFTGQSFNRLISVVQHTLERYPGEKVLLQS